MNQLLTRTLHERVHARHLAHDNARLREALHLIADMAEHSTSALTMTDIARIARGVLAPSQPANPALEHTT